MGVKAMDTEFVLIDIRWRETGWLEAFRLRLTGWLPTGEVVAGVNKGVLKQGRDVRSVELSDKGAALTDMSATSRTDENVKMLAEVLKTFGFEKHWLKPSDPRTAIFIAEKYAFDATYRGNILSLLARDDNIK